MQTNSSAAIRRFAGYLAAFVVLNCPSLAAEIKYALSGDNTKVEFVGSKSDGKHNGGFTKLKGTVVAPKRDVTAAKVDVEIDCASIYTDTEKLTKHLMSPDFFDVKTHPKARFVSTKITGDEKAFKMTGDFTLLGKKASITVPVAVKQEGDAFTLSSEFKINRQDYGLTYGAGKIQDDVLIKLNINAKKTDIAGLGK